MKKRILLILLAVLCVISLAACSCEHKWEKATCEDPKTCKKCGEEKGKPLGHEWLDATYDEPQTCENCGETKGKPLERPANGFDPVVEEINDALSADGYKVEFSNYADDGDVWFKVYDAKGNLTEVDLLLMLGSDGETVIGAMACIDLGDDDEALTALHSVGVASWEVINPKVPSDMVSRMLNQEPFTTDDGTDVYHSSNNGYDHYIMFSYDYIFFSIEKA